MLCIFFRRTAIRQQSSSKTYRIDQLDSYQGLSTVVAWRNTSTEFSMDQLRIPMPSYQGLITVVARRNTSTEFSIGNNRQKRAAILGIAEKG